MPELAEVETVRRGLETVALNKKIKGVEIIGLRTVRRHDPRVILDELPGTKFVAFRRRGKYLLCDTSDDRVLVVHLRMSGQLLWKPKTDVLEKHTHARILFSKGEELRFVDPRTFGELWLSEQDLPEMSHIGPDAWTEVNTVDEFRERLLTRKSPIKAVLLNQEVIAGLGNIYTDEMLWRAKIRYSKKPQELTKPAIARLFEAMRDVLDAAVAAGGSTLSDSQYVDLFGNTGSAQSRHDAYAREHEPCRRCGHPIKRAAFGGRSTFFCPYCQKA